MMMIMGGDIESLLRHANNLSWNGLHIKRILIDYGWRKSFITAISDLLLLT